MEKIYRIFVEKKEPFAIEAQKLMTECSEVLQVQNLEKIRVLYRYDVQNISEELFDYCRETVFSEPPVDNTYTAVPQDSQVMIAVEALPGQFDQRADSAQECIQLISQGERPIVRCASLYLFYGNISLKDIEKIKTHLINPVESREAKLELPKSLTRVVPVPENTPRIKGFITMDKKELRGFLADEGLAMDDEDLFFCQQYFISEKRDPTYTEIKVIDTYWSDHCRHTTFSTHLENINIEDPLVHEAFKRYLAIREDLNYSSSRPLTLMDIATIGTKKLKQQGYLQNIDESEEINACSINITVARDGTDEDWLLMFKNETHNHPTEIEPFGGAATCIGGAIRDPLSGRTYVYQAMRVTGAANPLTPISETLPGKLPQRKIVTTAANGYSSYGNQIGLATGLVEEIYHPGYAAKRMEVGAVLGAAPKSNVVREVPAPRDIVVLVGGRTGKDGLGGATGSSKSHTMDSVETGGAEVQKGNPVVERKLQRLFRNPDVSRLIKRCNDFGAGGVSVAVGELADGLMIDLNKVPKKYEGLSGTELAISESQERMAVVLDPKDVQAFLQAAEVENLEATVIAEVTQNPYMIMTHEEDEIVCLSRAFLNSNGAPKKADVTVVNKPVINQPATPKGSLEEQVNQWMGKLNHASQQGLSETFDSSIGAASVVMPFGGKHQKTPTQSMIAKIPVLQGDTTTCSVMAYGFNPYVSEQSPYLGAYYAVVESIAKVVASGLPRKNIYLTFQEYFERLKNEPIRWGKPVSALLGALDAQMNFKVAAIGGKDSMSGSFEELDVPPTLISFAVSHGSVKDVCTPEFKKPGSKLYLVKTDPLEDPQGFLALCDQIHEGMGEGKVLSAYALSKGGLMEALCKSAMGNQIGAEITNLTQEELFAWQYGSFLLEAEGTLAFGSLIGKTLDEYVLVFQGEKADLHQQEKAYEDTLESVFPRYAQKTTESLMDPNAIEAKGYSLNHRVAYKGSITKPKAFIPAFPGTNCEVDTLKAVERAGGSAEIFVIQNLTPKHIRQSIQAVADAIKTSQMIIFPGGFSGGDEPEGSAKLIASFFRNAQIKDAVHDLLHHRQGLILGICNGFQALVKLGLLPYGEIKDIQGENDPTLTFNTLGRHQSMMVQTKVVSNLSPWLSKCIPGDIHTIPISHGEGRFIADMNIIHQLAEKGQIATQYVDLKGIPAMSTPFNPNGSMAAIEGITSADGRIFGKMGHSERTGDYLYQNIKGNLYQPLFEGAMDYFK